MAASGRSHANVRPSPSLFFLPESDATVNGVLYVKANRPYECWAYHGFYPTKKSYMNIGSNCASRGIVLQELLRVVNMYQQHRACYRNNYITVYSGNILSGEGSKFERMSCDHGYEYVYDYGSIMHYGEYTFSKNNQKTIDCRGHSCGQLTGLSIYDSWEIMVLYAGWYMLNDSLLIP